MSQSNPAALNLLIGASAELIMATTRVREVLMSLPHSRDKSLALTKLDELDYWGCRAAAMTIKDALNDAIVEGHVA